MQPWMLWTMGIPTDVCDSIIERSLLISPVEATLGEEGITDQEYRSSVLRWLSPQDGHNDISLLLMKFVNHANRTNYGFDISFGMNELQFTEYHAEQAGRYDFHNDVIMSSSNPYQRKLSVVVQLSEIDEYEGGQFEFFNKAQPGNLFLPKGSVLVFPSFLEHRVLPITRGTRRSLVSWIEGKPFT